MRQNFGLCLSIAGMAVQQDHVANAAREDRFLVSGLTQSGQPAEGVAGQRSAGHAIMSSLLAVIFPGSERPCNGRLLLSVDLMSLTFTCLLLFFPSILLQLLGRFDFVYYGIRKILLASSGFLLNLLLLELPEYELKSCRPFEKV